MNKQTRQNRSKRVRLTQEKHGNKSVRLVEKRMDGASYSAMEHMAADKTPRTLRQGNYYTQTPKHVKGPNKGPGNTYMVTEPMEKVRARQDRNYHRSQGKLQGMFDVSKIMSKLKSFFGGIPVKA